MKKLLLLPLLGLLPTVCDGGDVAARFANDPVLRRVPSIMLTALVSNGETDPDAVIQANSMNMLPTPVNMDLMRRCIRNAIEQGDPVGV